MKYYDIHVFISRKNGYSLPIAIDTEEDLSEDEVIEKAVEENLFTEDGDESMVDNVTEMDEAEWKEFFNKD
jgi:hypothetical protein